MVAISSDILRRMNLSEYLKSLSRNERQVFVQRVKRRVPTLLGYLRLVARGDRTPNAELAIAIEEASDGAVPCEITRPKANWAYIRGTAKPQPQSTEARPCSP